MSSASALSKNFAVFCEPKYRRPGQPNEDTYVTFEVPKPEGRGVYEVHAVFDGHGGHQASTLCAAKVEEVFGTALATALTTDADAGSDFMNSVIRSALHDTIMELDKLANADPEKPPYCGTTAVIVVLDMLGKCGWVSNSGDSESTLVYQDRHIVLTVKHQATYFDEVHRVTGQDVGAQIGYGGKRLIVNVSTVGEIALEVTRSLGHGNCTPKGALIPDPTVSEFEIDDDVLAIVVGSDGLFDDRFHGPTYKSIQEKFVSCTKMGLDLDELVTFVSIGVRNDSDDATGIIRVFDKFEEIVATDSDKQQVLGQALALLEKEYPGHVWSDLSQDDVVKPTGIEKYNLHKDRYNNTVYFFLEGDKLVWLTQQYTFESFEEYLASFGEINFLTVGNVEEPDDSGNSDDE